MLAIIVIVNIVQYPFQGSRLKVINLGALKALTNFGGLKALTEIIAINTRHHFGAIAAYILLDLYNCPPICITTAFMYNHSSLDLNYLSLW